MNDKRNTKCQSKNPETCRYHGTHLGVVAFQQIETVIQERTANPDSVRTIDTFDSSIKTFDSHELADLLITLTDDQDMDMTKVTEAMSLAADMHRSDLRSNRAQHEKTPYIEHPFRNTIRVLRWGCKDEDTAIATILHDTVEDHPHEIAETYGKNEPTEDEHEAREQSFQYIEEQFGKNVSDTVRGMSNPIYADRYMPAAQKNVIYRDHVEEAIENPRVCLSKFSDLVDNAFSLHHTEPTMSAVSLKKKSDKYLLVMDVFKERFERALWDRNFPMEDQRVMQLMGILERGRERLAHINKKYSVK